MATDPSVPLKLIALGDRIQAVLEDSDLAVIGFTVLVRDGHNLTGESRSHVGQGAYEDALAAYLTPGRDEVDPETGEHVRVVDVDDLPAGHPTRPPRR